MRAAKAAAVRVRVRHRERAAVRCGRRAVWSVRVRAGAKGVPAGHAAEVRLRRTQVVAALCLELHVGSAVRVWPGAGGLCHALVLCADAALGHIGPGPTVHIGPGPATRSNPGTRACVAVASGHTGTDGGSRAA